MYQIQEEIVLSVSVPNCPLRTFPFVESAPGSCAVSEGKVITPSMETVLLFPLSLIPFPSVLRLKGSSNDSTSLPMRLPLHFLLSLCSCASYRACISIFCFFFSFARSAEYSEGCATSSVALRNVSIFFLLRDLNSSCSCSLQSRRDSMCFSKLGNSYRYFWQRM